MPSCAAEQDNHSTVAEPPPILGKHEAAMETPSEPTPEENARPKEEAMKLQTNASTHDLLSLESGPQTPDHVTMNSTGNVDSSAQPSSQNITPVMTPHQTPSIRRKSRNTLRLNLDETTWSQAVDPAKTQATTKLRQNLQAGAARVSAVVQRGKTPEFRFRLVLVFLFGSIIALITITYYLYQRHMLQLTFGDKIRFIEVQREIHLLTADGREVLRGTVGLHIPPQLSPFDCQLKSPQSSRCVEWKYRALLTIDYTHEANLSCYDVRWRSLSRATKLKDCFALSGGAYWYGMGEVYNSSWPLSGIVETPHAFITGDLGQDDFGAILERYWLSSRGVAIRVSPDVPLYISLNNSGDERLCLEAKHDGFPYYESADGLPTLEYAVCTGPDMKGVHERMVKKYFRLPNATVRPEFLNHTVWDTGPRFGARLDPDSLTTFAGKIVDMGQIGSMVIDHLWQWKDDDDFRTNASRSPQEAVQVVHNKGFKVLLPVTPYVCMGSPGFEEGIEGRYFLSDSRWAVPLLTRWKGKVCAIIDVTDNSSADWFLARIREVKDQFNVDGFVFLGGQSSFLPRNYNFRQKAANPDEFLSHYAALASRTSSFVGVSFGFGTQNISAFVNLAPRTSSWDGPFGLQSIIPAVLTLGLLGYPIVNPGSVGGDILNGSDVDKELYMRWFQLAVFMPVMQLSALPEYDLEVIIVFKVLLKLRTERVMTLMNSLIQEYLTTGAPIVRPLWWLAPNDSTTHTIDSQFAIGDKIIVAPVLEQGKLARDVYLPPGRWRDETQGLSRLGGKWMYNYSVPLKNVAMFTREE